MSENDKRVLRKYNMGGSSRFAWRDLDDAFASGEEDVRTSSLVHGVAELYKASYPHAGGPRFYTVTSYKGNDGCHIKSRWYQDFLEYIDWKEKDPDASFSHMAIVIAPSKDFGEYDASWEDDSETYAVVTARVLEALGLSDQYGRLIVFDGGDGKIDELVDVMGRHGIRVAYDAREVCDSLVEKGTIRADAEGHLVYRGRIAASNERTVAAACLIHQMRLAASQWASDTEISTLLPVFPEGLLSAISLGRESRNEKRLVASIRKRDSQMAKIGHYYDPAMLVSAKGCSRLAESAVRVRDLRKLWSAYAGHPTVYGKDAASAARFGYDNAREKALRAGLDSAVEALYEGVPVEDILEGAK